MVSPTKPQHSRVASHQQSHKCKLIKGSKPLVNFRFYLDIEKHPVSSKIELKIKELGGSIEFFLAKEVTHFVTDKQFENQRDQNCPSPSLNSAGGSHQQPITPQTPRTPQTPYTPLLCDIADAISPNVSVSNESKAPPTKHRSRADAMLQRARNHSTTTTTNDKDSNRSASAESVQSHHHSPVQLAKSWGTTIWSPEYTLKFLEKIKAALKLDFAAGSSHTVSGSGGGGVQSGAASHRRSTHAKRLKGEYVKIETFQRHYRPYYQEFKVWPQIHLNTPLGFCPFSQPPIEVVVKTQQQQQQQPEKQPIDAIKETQIDSPESANKMTRKNRGQKQMVRTATATTTAATAATTTGINKVVDIKRSSEKQCGYCEICRLEYDVLSVHLQSNEHVNFIKNANNFLTLDSLIKNSASVETFLQVNATALAPPPSPLETPPTKHSSIGKRSSVCGKKNDKLIRQIDSNPADEFIQVVNGNKTTMMSTRRSNHRRRVGEQMKKCSPKRTKIVDIESDADNNSDVESVSAVAEDVSIVADDTEPTTKLRSRRESAKRVNYAEPKEDDTAAAATAAVIEASSSNELKMQKIRMRGIRWRQPSEDEHMAAASSGVSQLPAVYKVMDDTAAAAAAANRSKSQRSSSRKETTSTATSAIATASTNATAAAAASPTKDAGIKVRICRVRESELSLLTNEADQFMFPRLPSELPTDEDRQTTPEPTDVSVEIESSEMDRGGGGGGGGGRSSRNVSESSARDLDASNKRKRRKQLESFLNDNSEYYKFDNPDSRLRFQEAPFQPSLIRFDNDPTTTTTMAMNNSNQFQHHHSSHHNHSTRSSMISASSSSSSTKKLIDMNASSRDTEDGKGAASIKKYDKGELLKSDIVKRHKFAFERIPSTEPWFEAFQRQDECRERIFEYWGSTAYRKLPFELGPLPPHSADCCHLAKLIGTKKGAKKNNRKNKKIDCAAAQSLPLLHASATINSSSSPAATVAESENQLDDQKRLADVSEEMAKKLQNEELKIQKRLLKIQKQLEVQRPIPPPSSQTQSSDGGGGGGGSGNSCNNNSTSRDTNKKSGTSAMYFSSSISTRGDARSMLTIKTAETIEKKLHRRNLMKDFVPNLNGERKGHQLLDINGQPRKSPREHASTLAILSCLVQQRRKREKELNGGISPEKLAQQRNNDDNNTTDADDDCDDDDDGDDDDGGGSGGRDPNDVDDCDALTEISKSDSESVVRVAKQECDSDGGGGGGGLTTTIDRPASSTRSRRSSIFGDEDSNISTTRSAAAAAVAAISAPISVGRSCRTASPKIYNRKNIRKMSATAAKDRSKSKIATPPPKVPVPEYVNPHHVCRQIDELLTADLIENDELLIDADVDDDAEDFNMPEISASYGDLVLISTPRDFLDIVNSVPAGPLTYQSTGRMRKSIALSSFMRGGSVSLTGAGNRKRRNNRTGWPSIPKRRSVMIKKEELECESSNTNTEAEDEKQSKLTNDQATSANCTLDKLKTTTTTTTTDQEEGPADEYCKNGGGGGVFTLSSVFTSSSEKAEHSDIFTVSSDSVDTADLAALVKNSLTERRLTTLKTNTSLQSLHEVENDGEDEEDDDDEEEEEGGVVEEDQEQPEEEDEDGEGSSVPVKLNMVTSDDSSADCTLAEMLKKEIGSSESKKMSSVDAEVIMTDDEDPEEEVELQQNDEDDCDDDGDDDDDDDAEYVSVSSHDGNDVVGSVNILANSFIPTEQNVPVRLVDTKKILQPIVRVRKIDNYELNRRVKIKVLPINCHSASSAEPEEQLKNQPSSPMVKSTGTSAAAAAVSLATSCRPTAIHCTPKTTQFSPPKLRKPRGRWYRERYC